MYLKLIKYYKIALVIYVIFDVENNIFGIKFNTVLYRGHFTRFVVRYYL